MSVVVLGQKVLVLWQPELKSLKSPPVAFLLFAVQLLCHESLLWGFCGVVLEEDEDLSSEML